MFGLPILLIDSHLMRKLFFLLFVIPIFCFSQTTIKIDGFFDDWNSNINNYIDDSTDSQGIELLGFSVCNDNEYLYIKIRCGSEIDLTEQFYNPAEVMINIDADNNSSTGYFTNNIGSEYGINFLAILYKKLHMIEKYQLLILR